MVTRKFFLMEGYGLKSNRPKWNKLDSAKQLKTVMKKMDEYNRTWDGGRNFAIVKSDDAVRGKMALRDADSKRRDRSWAKERNDASWRWDLRNKIRHGKKKKNYWGDVVRMQLNGTW
jgi:hypothetical protein